MVYFIKAGDYIKVGYSRDEKSFKTRLSSYHTSCPFEIEIISKLDGGVDLEKDVLNHFIKFHYKNEWLKYDESIVDFAKNPYLLNKSIIKKPNKSHKIITDNLNYIINKYKEGYSLKLLAEEFNINRARLTKYIPEEVKRKKNGWFSLRKRETNPKNKPVICITTGERFISVKDASRKLGVSSSDICRVCLGTRNHTHNLKFKYA